MATKLQGNTGNTGKIALLAGLIVVALAALAFSIYRSASATSGTISPEVKQMKASVRSRGRQVTPTGIGP